MFNQLLNVFKPNRYKNIHTKENYYSNNISKAIEYQKNGMLDNALEIYNELYVNLENDNCQKELALVLNNMIVIKKELNINAKELFNKLLELRFSLLIQYEEYYAIDYIYTLLMGVEWFGLPKDTLTKAESMLKIYSGFSIYQPTLEKINKLRAVD